MGAARRCFARKGFHAASTAEISAEAGISVANLYQYFPAKDDLIAAMVEDNLKADLEIIRMLANAGSFSEGLRVAGSWVANARSSSEIHAIKLEILAETFRRPAIAELTRQAEVQMIRALEQVILRAKERGEVAGEVDAREAAAMIIAFTDGVLSRTSISPLTADATASSFIAFTARALGLRFSAARTGQTTEDRE